jgi:flagellar hook-length control protein FliK
MHIEGVNLLSLLPGNNTTEGGPQFLPENGVIPGGFSNALMGQIGLLSEANGQVELPVQLQSMVMSQTIDNLHDIGDLLKQQIKSLNEANSQIELPAQLQSMTIPRTIDNLHDIGDLSKQQIKLLDEANSQVELPVQLQSVTMPQAIDNLLKQQIKLLNEANSQVELPAQLQTITVPQTIDNLHDIGDLQKHKGNEEELAVLLDDYLPLSYKKKGAVDPNEDIDLEATLLALTEALKSITPSSSPDEVATAQNMNDVMAFNGLSFVKPLPEEAKLNKLGEEDVTSGDFLQKETVLRRSIQDEQGFNLQALKNAESAEKTLVIEKQAFISGIEKTAPGVVADMAPLHRLVDNRTDSPAIARPLTHPDWSKDLGDQIVWMNNKAIPAAEIKLNPAHLGPISVRIDVNQDQATILFTAQHAEVKEAIEASIPKLREMLGTQQLNLINVNISQNSTSDQGRSQSQTFSKTPENHEQGIEGITDTLEKTEHDRIVSKGLLSIYA